MAKIISTLFDNRIKAYNILVEMPVSEYLEIADKILRNNEFQRLKIKSSPTVFALLKKDLKEGCVIPPIVMAITGDNFGDEKKDSIDNINIDKVLHRNDLLVLDGLQRTHSLRELIDELSENGDTQNLEKLNRMLLRVEVYIGLRRLAILYRMLTLNTGQTPMSLRQQIEILFLDYSKQDLGGIKLLREVNETKPIEIGEYSFKSVVEGFNSYLTRSELPIDRLDLLDNIKGLDDLSKEGLDLHPDLFKDFINTYNDFVTKLSQLASTWKFSRDEAQLKYSIRPFGVDVFDIFSRSQALTGYGCAMGKMKDFNLIHNFAEIKEMISKISLKDQKSLFKLLMNFDEISGLSTKIGNSQRMYFHYFFRELFNEQSDSYLTIDSAIDNAYDKYLSQTT